MTWIVIALVGYSLLALTFILDKYILSSTSIQRPSVYTFYSTIILWAALLLLLIDPGHFSTQDIVISLCSGIAFGLGLFTLYFAIKGGETSHVSPFNGAVVTLTTYALSHVFLSEHLSQGQLIGIVFLIAASIFLSYQETKTTKGFSRLYWWAVVSGLFFGMSHVAAKYIYMIHEFIPAFAWTRAGAGIVGLLLLWYPPVYRELLGRMKKTTPQKKQKKQTSLVIVWVAKLSGVVAVVMIQYASALGSVSVVQAMSGLQYALMFVAIYLLSKWSSKLFKEYVSKKEIAIQSLGIILVIIGSLFFI